MMLGDVVLVCSAEITRVLDSGVVLTDEDSGQSAPTSPREWSAPAGSDDDIIAAVARIVPP